MYEQDMKSKVKNWFSEKNNPVDKTLMEKDPGIRRKEQNQEAAKTETLLRGHQVLS